MTTIAVVPVKQLENAKQRLADLLTPAERRELMRAMVEDVLAALKSSSRIDTVMVVTGDAAVSELAGKFGAEIMAEPAVPGLIPAVAEAGKALALRGVANMLFVPGDIPLVTGDEIEIAMNGVGTRDAPEFVIVPAHDLGGSNCVVCSPPDCMEFGFGEDSFRRHLRIARTLGISPAVARLPGIGLDVDTKDDLYELAKRLKDEGRETNTSRFLSERGIMERLEERLLRIG